ncbi:MAG: hypothetical protein IAE81_24790 [Caldilineaceae bacterium]|nr:hypothetical protein [Caldilineaceae bacterium]
MTTKRITAINMLRPRTLTSTMVDMKTLASYVATRANMSVSDVSHALEELHNAVLFFCALGHSVKLEGLGVYRPDVELDGTKTIHYRIDRDLIKNINIGTFAAKIENAENMGKTPDELVTLWNEIHPEEPVAP